MLLLCPAVCLTFLLKLIGMFPVFAIFVVFLTLFRIAQYFVGFIHLLELSFCRRVILVQVRMIFLGQLPVCLLDFILSGITVYSQNLIVINKCHISIVLS